jgi:hypothetical protein
MRKLMCYCALVALLGAAGVYLSAQYACRHPDSVLGQCAITGCRAGAVCAPVAQVGEASVERTFEAIREVMDRPGMAPTVVDAPPEPPAADVEVPADPEPVVKGEPAEEAGPVGKIVIQPDPEEPAPAAGAAEEAEVPPPMPRAREDEVPPKMPYARDEDRDGAGPRQDLGRKLMEEWMRGTDIGPTEECEPALPDTGACREDPNYDRQYPACPHMGSCPHGGCCPNPGKCPACPGLHPVTEEKAAPGTKEAGEEESTPVEKLPVLPRYDREGAGPKKHSNIDTTEFRPSDGKPFDYRSSPY